jgi:hypothetical protein
MVASKNIQLRIKSFNFVFLNVNMTSHAGPNPLDLKLKPG